MFPSIVYSTYKSFSKVNTYGETLSSQTTEVSEDLKGRSGKTVLIVRLLWWFLQYYTTTHYQKLNKTKWIISFLNRSVKHKRDSIIVKKEIYSIQYHVNKNLSRFY